MLRKPKRELVDRTSAAVLELQLNLTYGHRSIARLQKAVVEGDLDRPRWQLNDPRASVDIGGKDRFKLVTFEIGAEIRWDEGDRESEIGINRRDGRLPLATPERIVSEFSFHGLHEARAVLPNPQAQSVASKRPLGCIVVNRLMVLSCALVACVRRDDRSGVEICQAVISNKKFEFDFPAHWQSDFRRSRITLRESLVAVRRLLRRGLRAPMLPGESDRVFRRVPVLLDKITLCPTHGGRFIPGRCCRIGLQHLRSVTLQ